METICGFLLPVMSGSAVPPPDAGAVKLDIEIAAILNPELIMTANASPAAANLILLVFKLILLL